VRDAGVEEPERWEPIAGVDLEAYARITALLLRRGISGADVDAVVGALGMNADDWHAASQGWSARIASDDRARAAYSEYYQHARASGPGAIPSLRHGTDRDEAADPSVPNAGTDEP
jgi:hypothetical protein